MAIDPTVFVVDDDPALRRSLSYLIESVGLEVEAFAGGEAFLEACDPERPGVLVLDLRMPGIGGLELIGAKATASLYREALYLILDRLPAIEAYDRLERDVGRLDDRFNELHENIPALFFRYRETDSPGPPPCRLPRRIGA